MAWNVDEEIVQRAKPRIAICVPHTHNVTMYWTERAYGPLRFRPLSWCDKKPYLSFGPPIDIARNELCQQALNDNMDYVFFLDSDVVPREPEDINLALYKLWSLQAPLVTGLYRAKKRYGWHWAAWTDVNKDLEGLQPLVNFDNPIFPIDVAGLGCTLIHTDVLRNVPQPWFKWEGMDTYSEDFYFFLKCKEHGYNLIAHGGVRFDHIGTFMVTGDRNEGEVTLLGDYFKDKDGNE